MKRTLIPALALLCALFLSACVKTGTKANFNSDNTGAVSLKFAYKTEAIEQIKSMLEMQGGGEVPEEADQGLRELTELVDETKVREKFKKLGLEVTSAKASEKDGWKNIEVDATIADVNATSEKASKESEAKLGDSPFGNLKMSGLSNGITLPRFYKTDVEGVGQAVFIPALSEIRTPDGQNPFEMIEDLDDESRDQLEGQFEMVKSMLSLDEMSNELTIKLPGPIVATKGCKKLDDNAVNFTIKGSDFTIDALKNYFGMKDGVSATFQIPEGCKITFADPPAKAAKKAATGDEGEAEGEKKPKKGGLKIGEEKKGG